MPQASASEHAGSFFRFYKFRIIATETKISGYQEHRYCKSSKYIGYDSGISRKMDVKKHNCIRQIAFTISRVRFRIKITPFYIERLSRKYDSGVSFFSKRYTSKPAEFCQCCFSPVRFTLICFTLVRLPDLNYNSFMTSMTGCLLFPQKGFLCFMKHATILPANFARMAHVTLRTVRYYDKQDILKPSLVTNPAHIFI